VFNNVASKYDMMNDAMSLCLHRLWKAYFVRKLAIVGPDIRLIDVAGGTGDIAFRVLQDPRLRRRRRIGADSVLTVVDINENMLEVGQLRAEEEGRKKKATDAETGTKFMSASPTPLDSISWICADAENLPFVDSTFDIYTIAFGIRNCTNIDKVLTEAFRVLRPHGQFSCLEFSRVECSLFRRLYDLYSFQAIPVMGQLLAGDFKSYRYLIESIRMFPSQDDFSALITAAGFQHVTYENLSGGICAIHTGITTAK